MSGPREQDARPPVVVVAGPTASGKTDLAIELARRFGGEVLNADSMQVYRYMDIGTAKPGAEQRARAVHHLIDLVDPDVQYDAGRYARDARRAAALVHGRGALPIACGGSGLYLRAFLEGMIQAPGRDPELRRALEREHAEARAAGDPERLHRRLRALDPEAARRIHPNDRVRIVRALELGTHAGRPASELRAGHDFADHPYRVLYLVVDPGREALIERIDRRCEAMIRGGLLQEVRDLRERGYGPELASMQGIGYRHMQPVLDGLETLVNVQAAMQHDTRQFARRQRTWCRAVAGAVWVHPEDRAGIAKRVEEFLGA